MEIANGIAARMTEQRWAELFRTANQIIADVKKAAIRVTLMAASKGTRNTEIEKTKKLRTAP
jgi:hypothetical protein